MTVFGWALLSGDAQGATVTVNTDQKEQPIRGFGGMTHPVWIKDLTASQRETAFGNGKNQLGLSVLRIHVDEDRNNWYKEVPTARAAVKNHAIVFATAWNAPLSMTQIYHKQGTKEGVPSRRVNPASYGEYTAYLNDF